MKISNKLTRFNNSACSLPETEIGKILLMTLLEKLGFTIKGHNDISFDVTVPEGWKFEEKGLQVTFLGPQGQKLRSFIKNDPWDRNSFLEITNVKGDS